MKNLNQKMSAFKSMTPKPLKEASNICTATLCDTGAKGAEEIVQKGTFSKDFKRTYVREWLLIILGTRTEEV